MRYTVLFLLVLILPHTCSLTSIEKLSKLKVGYASHSNTATTLVIDPHFSNDVCVALTKENNLQCNVDQFHRSTLSTVLDGVITVNILSNDSRVDEVEYFITDNYDSIGFLSDGILINYPAHGSSQDSFLNLSVSVSLQYPYCYLEVLGIYNATFPTHLLKDGPFTADDIEPASWFYEVVPALETITEDGMSKMLFGLPTPGYIEFVLSDENIIKHRKFSQLVDNYASTQLDVVGTDAVSSSNKKINVCVWTSLSMDGQKSIWLQQTEFMDKTKFHFTWILSLQNGKTLDEKAYPELLERTSVYSYLKKFGASVSVMDSPFNYFSVDKEDLYTPPVDGSPSAAEVWQDDVNKLYKYIHDRFAAADYVIERISPKWCVDFYVKMLEVLQQGQCDVLVYGNARGFSSDVFITDAARVLGIPTVTELLNLYLNIESIPDAVVAPSTYAVEHESISTLEEYINEHKALNSQKYGHVKVPQRVVIPPSVNMKKFHPSIPAGLNFTHGCENVVQHWGENERHEGHWPCFSIGFIARLSPEKSPGLFLQAAYEILQLYPFARFTFVGDGILSKSLRQLAKRLEISYAVSFLGWVNDQLPQVIKTFDVVVNPSLRAWSETFCIANIEVMSMEVPLVTFGVGGIGEYVRPAVESDRLTHNDSGLFSVTSNAVLVHTATPEALTKAVHYLILNPKERIRIGKEGRTSIVQYFNVDRQMQQYSDLYTQLYVDRK